MYIGAAMSDQRRPTTRLGKARQRDPRVDSVPPSTRKAEAKDGAADIDELLGRLLARATQAEVHAQHLEQTLQRLNEERAVLEARASELARQLEDADTHRASLEAQLRSTSQSRRTEAPITLAYVRSMAAELVRALDRLPNRGASSEYPRSPSDAPTPRPRSERPSRR
jgi:phage shock protein A